MTEDHGDARRGHPVVCVTGPSGAGRTTAINALEDMGFEAIANLPLALAPHLLEGPPPERPIALGIDTRSRGFSVGGFIGMAENFDSNPKVQFSLLYLDCAAEALLRRYSETRRRHPSAPAEHPAQGIAREAELLAPIRRRSDIVINTTDMTPHELRAELRRRFEQDASTGLAVSVQSFSYKRGVPRGLDMVFDCRFLRNPYWEASLRHLDGRDGKVAGHIRADPRFAPFLEHLDGLTGLLLPAHVEEGRAHLAIGFGCTGGQHRSVMLAETLAESLAQAGWQVSKRHRELEAHGEAGAGVRTG